MARFATVAAVLALMAAPLVAQESTEQLRKELESLRKEVDGLKAERAQYESKEVTAPAKAGAEAMSPDGDSPVMTALKETKLSGFVDTTYVVSFNHLSAGNHNVNASNPVRVFDNKENSFYLNAVQLNLERLATEKMIVGYHLELAAGHDPSIYDGAGVVNNVSLQEGWVQILAPVGTGLDIRIGKMATLLGYEVIESKDNMNISRSLLFGQIENFTNTGIRMQYNITEQFWATLGFNNGANALTASFDDTYSDPNHGKAVELQFGAKPTKDLLATVSLLTGTEDTVSTNDKFYIFDIVVAYTMDKLTVALNFDASGAEVGASGPGGHFPKTGIALYGKYSWTDAMASALRVEYMSDAKGGNPALVPSAAGDTGDGARVVEVTLTQEVKIASQLILRAELRFDNCNQHVFNRDGNPARGDNTLGFEAIMPF